MTVKIFDEEVGLPKEGYIYSFDSINRIIKVKLKSGDSIQNNYIIEVPFKPVLSQDNGLFISEYPSIGTPVVVVQGSGGRYYLLQSLTENLNDLDVTKDTITIKSSDFASISLNTSSDIKIGSDNENISINSELKQITYNFTNSYSFTDGSRKLTSEIYREKELYTNISSSSNLLDSKIYQQKYQVGLDPKSKTNTSKSKLRNPALIESRELIFEHKDSIDIKDDLTESEIYKSSSTNKNYTYPDRTKYRSNILNLNLNNPNNLMETVKGTLVDIFGNILDLNRYPLSFNSESTLSNSDNTDKSKAFLKLKELQRKSVAFHFELNARKDLFGSNGKISIPDVNSTTDNAKARSRFFIDIDKEGQFKINIPASSEVGNIPVLTRYENYSNVSTDDNNNPNKLIFREDYLDIVHDQFGKGKVSIKNDSGEVTPIDRITNSHLKLGTAYHDIFKTCFASQSLDFIRYQNDTTIQLNNSYLLKKVASDSVITSGPLANGGGRSGQINMDGSLELNIGANTVDRQSLWLDTAGGIVGNVGRDLNGNSLIFGMDGNAYVQVGGNGVDGDSRFTKQNNGYAGGILDIKVMRPGFQATMIRIDSEGVKILTAGRMLFHANSDIVFKSDATMTLEAENLIVNGRLVSKEFGGSI